MLSAGNVNWNKELMNILNDILARIHGNALSLNEIKSEIDDMRKNNEESKVMFKIIN